MYSKEADRKYLEPEEVGLGLINVKDYGDALRLTWAKRETDGIWSTVLRGQLTERYESVYKESSTVHNIHWPLLHITGAFKNFCIKFMETGDTQKLYTPTLNI